MEASSWPWMMAKEQLWEIQVTLQDEHIDTMDTSNKSQKMGIETTGKELDNNNNALEKVVCGHHGM